MNILFIVTSYWAYGELLIALQFAQELQKDGHKTYFLIPPTHKKIVQKNNIPYTELIPNVGAINRILMKDIEIRYKPEFIILSDFLNYNFCEKHYGINNKDLEIFSGKIGTFDNFDWKLERKMMDTYGFPSTTLRNVNVDNFGFRLNPCPIINPNSIQGENKILYPLVGDYLNYNDKEKALNRNELGLPLNKKIILVTSAAWQQKYMEYKDVKSFVDFSDEIYFKIIQKCSKDNLIIYVGGDNKNLDDENSNIIKLDSLQPNLFDKYAASSDLFISRNITSTSLARLALSGIPCVSIINSISYKNEKLINNDIKFEIDDGLLKEIQKLKLCYPFYMYPVGWFEFLKPVVENNQYYKIVHLLEQFNMDETINKIENLLRSKDIKDKNAKEVEIYRKHLDMLPNPREIISLLM